MVQLGVSELRVGETLSKPLYDEDGGLLLGVGQVVDDRTIELLHRRRMLYVFVDDACSDRPTEIHADETCKREARDLATALDAELRQLTNFGESGVYGTSVSDEYLSRVLTGKRSAESVQEARSLRGEGVVTLRNVAEGSLQGDEAAIVCRMVVDRLVEMFGRDRMLLTALSNLKDASENIYSHAMNMVILSLNIAAALKHDVKQMAEIGLSAMLCDLGMALVPKELRDAPRKLSAIERLDVQKHTMYSLYMLKKVPGLPRFIGYVAYQHHERCNGTGYLQRRTTKSIHPSARIVAVADVYDALTSPRPWREAMAPHDGMKQVIKMALQNELDGDCVNALLACLSLYPIGSLVSLSTGEIARVVRSNGSAFSRPVVVPVKFGAHSEAICGTEIDLAADSSVSIIEGLKNIEGAELVGFVNAP